MHAHRAAEQGMRCEAEHVHRSAVFVCFSKFVLQGKRRLPVLRLRVTGSGRCEDGLVKAERRCACGELELGGSDARSEPQ